MSHDPESQLHEYAAELASRIQHVKLEEIVGGAPNLLPRRAAWIPTRRRRVVAILAVTALVIATLGTAALVVANRSTKVLPAGPTAVVTVSFELASLKTYEGFTGGGLVRFVSCVQGGDTCLAGGVWESEDRSKGCTSRVPCQLPLVLIYRGGSWSEARPLLPHEPSYASVSQVECSSDRSCDVFVVPGSSGPFSEFLEHFDGFTWSIIPLPTLLANSEVGAIACPTANECYVSGGELHLPSGSELTLPSLFTLWIVEYLDGRWLAPAYETSFDLDALWCQSPVSCLAVGANETSNRSTLSALQLTKGRWRYVSSAPPAGASMRYTDVSCGSAQACVAVGNSFTTSVFATADVVEVWRADHFVLGHGPSVPADQIGLYAVSCGTHWGCLAVGGGYSKGAKPEILAINTDGTWQPVAGDLSPGGPLASLSCLSATQCFASDPAGIVSIAAP